MKRHHVAITGGIASGKSIASKVFEILGASVYNADSEAKHIMLNEPEIRDALILKFGKSIYLEDDLNKELLASLIFENKENREFVNNLIHPRVLNNYLSWRNSCTKKITVLELALIHTFPLKNIADSIVVLDCENSIRIERLMRRNAYSESEASKRIAAQPTRDEYVQLADYVVENNGNDFLIKQLMNIYNKISMQ